MNNFKNATALYQVQTISSPVVSEQEEVLLYVETVINEKEDRYEANIRKIDLNTNEDHVLISNGSINKSLSLKGDELLYLSNQTGSFQVHYFHLETKEEKQLTYAPKGVQFVEWIPNHDQFLFTTELKKDMKAQFQWDELEPDEVGKASYYHLKKLNYQADGVGFINHNFGKYLCVQSIGEGTVTVISRQDTGYALRRVADVSQDGEMIVFEKRLHHEDDFNHDSGLFLYKIKEGNLVHLTEKFETGIFGEAAFSPDGKYIAIVGNTLPYETVNQFGLYLYDLENDTFKNLSENKDIHFADTSVSDFFQNVKHPTIQWDYDSKHFYVQTSEYGSVKLYRVDIHGKMEQLSEDHSVVKEIFVSKKGNLFATISLPKEPIKIVKYENGSWAEIPTAISNFYKKFDFATYQEVQYRAEDGGIIHGYMVLPPNFKEDKKYPLVLSIHGGPYMMHASVFNYEVQHLAANDYIVLLINPRGSYGYGQKHAYGVYEKYGKEDYSDLMTAVDQVVEDYSFIDANNLFVTGGSYGGFMTNWIVTQTNRFRAAVSERSMSNFVSMFGTSDIGYFFYKDETGYDISHAEKLWEASPLAYVKNVETPVLLIHAMEDLRCQFEQAQQFYTSLLYFGKKAEMIVFPNSTHELSRSGLPSYRVARLEKMLEWFEGHRV